MTIRLTTLVALSLTAALHAQTLFTNATLIDGSGEPARPGARVLVVGDEIVAVGEVEEARIPANANIIDLDGLVLAPGFVDLHSHSDGTLLADGRSLSKITQGVTTEICGENNSFAPRPRRPGTRIRGKAPWKELLSLGEWFGQLEKRGISVNLATYVGSGRLRGMVVGSEEKAATEEQLETMCALLDAAMRDGALGLSSGLIYVPGRYAPTAELIELAQVVGRYGGVYGTHMRTEGRNILTAIDEAARIGREGGVVVDIFHLKVTGENNHGRMPAVLARIAEHREDGVNIGANLYPYTATSTTATIILPSWAQEGGSKQAARRLRDPETRERIRKELTARDRGFASFDEYLETVVISRVSRKENRALLGKSFAEVGREQDRTPIDAYLELLDRENGAVGAVYLGRMSEKDVEAALCAPFVSIGSDGSGLAPSGPLARNHPHPRSYGTFPRVLGRYVRERAVISLPECIRKVSRQAAERMGFADRGLVRPGFKADLVVFDPEAVIDRATFAQPHQLSQGVRHVMVNGELVLRDGKHTGAKPGRILRGPGHQPR